MPIKTRSKKRRTVREIMGAATKIQNTVRKKAQKKRHSAATKIQKKVRDTRMNLDKGIQYEEFLSYLVNEYGADLKAVREWFHIPDIRHNLWKTELLMIDTTIENGAMKRTLVCVDVDQQGYIDSVNKNCLTDREAGRWTDMGPFIDSDGPWATSILRDRTSAYRATLPGANITGVPMVDIIGRKYNKKFPTVSQVGLTDEEVLDLLENNSVNYCKFPVFKRLCIKLRRNIRLEDQRHWAEDTNRDKNITGIMSALNQTDILNRKLPQASMANVPSGIMLPSGNILWNDDPDRSNIMKIYQILQKNIKKSMSPQRSSGERLRLSLLDEIKYRRPLTQQLSDQATMNTIFSKIPIW